MFDSPAELFDEPIFITVRLSYLSLLCGLGIHHMHMPVSVWAVCDRSLQARGMSDTEQLTSQFCWLQTCLPQLRRRQRLSQETLPLSTHRCLESGSWSHCCGWYFNFHLILFVHVPASGQHFLSLGFCSSFSLFPPKSNIVKWLNVWTLEPNCLGSCSASVI